MWSIIKKINGTLYCFIYVTFIDLIYRVHSSWFQHTVKISNLQVLDTSCDSLHAINFNNLLDLDEKVMLQGLKYKCANVAKTICIIIIQYDINSTTLTHLLVPHQAMNHIVNSALQTR